MGTPKLKRGCNRVEESGTVDANRNGYDEEPAQYMANTKKGFWKSVKEFFQI